MAQRTDQSLLDKLLKTRYPLTNYFIRQQQFIKTYSTPQSIAVPTPPPEPAAVVIYKQKVSLPTPSCFNVPDTLDFDATGYEENNEMDQSSEMDDNGTRQYDETLLLKSIDNRISDNHSDMIHGRNALLLQCSSTIELEFSPYENNSPLQKAIENGLNIINK